MRYFSLALGLGCLLVAAGCNQFQPMQPGPAPQQNVRVPTNTPGAADLIDYLNRNARLVQAIDCRDLDLDASQGSGLSKQSGGLRGWLVCQKQRDFRMGGKVLGKDAVDMGSNSQEFWYWISRAEPPYLFHCSYADLNQGRAQMPFPFQPEWIMEGLGMAEYGPADHYKVNVTAQTLELIEETRSPQGAALRKVTVFSRVPAQGNQPQVVAHILQNANGKEICGAYISEVQQDRSSGAIVPKRLELRWPAEQMSLKMKLSDVTVNPSIAQARAATLFTRPRLTGVQSYDLASRAVDVPGGQVQRTSGVQTR
jgi:hypothetical protein